jgi:hypothetical protein
MDRVELDDGRTRQWQRFFFDPDGVGMVQTLLWAGKDFSWMRLTRAATVFGAFTVMWSAWIVWILRKGHPKVSFMTQLSSLLWVAGNFVWLEFELERDEGVLGVAYEDGMNLALSFFSFSLLVNFLFFLVLRPAQFVPLHEQEEVDGSIHGILHPPRAHLAPAAGSTCIAPSAH